MRLSPLHLIAAATVVSCVATLGGCSNGTASAPTDAIRQPGAGSMWIVQREDYRSPQHTMSYDTVTVISREQTFDGKSNVLRLHHTKRGEEYVNYESNGDISLYLGAGTGMGGDTVRWLRIPLHSKSAVDLTHRDSSFTLTYDGTDTVRTESRLADAHRILELINWQRSRNIYNDLYTNYYDKTTGILVRSDFQYWADRVTTYSIR